MKVSKDYTLQERYGLRYYEISLDSPGYNSPTSHFYENCKVTNSRKIAKLQAQAKALRNRLVASDKITWTEVK